MQKMQLSWPDLNQLPRHARRMAVLSGMYSSEALSIIYGYREKGDDLAPTKCDDHAAQYTCVKLFAADIRHVMIPSRSKHYMR